MKPRKVRKLQAWIKKEFPTREANGLHAAGHSLGYGFITIEFMDNDKGVWLILCTDYSSERREHNNRMNIGTYTSIRAVKNFLKAFIGY
jgi:hypothetical protein